MFTVLLIYMILITDIETMDYEQFVLDKYRQNCPYSHTCTRESKMVFPKDKKEDYSSCCLPCSCEENCSKTKSCCPDALNSSMDHVGNKNTECLTSGYPVDDQKHNGMNSYLKRHNTIRTCPSTYQNKNTVSKCIRRSPKTLDELIFVSDEDGKIYRNLYCALCNNVFKFIRWDLFIRCSQYKPMTFNRSFTPENIKQSGCVVWSEAPQHTRLAKRSSCYLVTFDKCNMTGTLSEYDANIDKACRRGHYGLYLADGKFYQNIFCFLCNPRRYMDYKYDECLSFHSRDVFKSFSAIIDTRAVSSASDFSAGCGINKIYDKYADKCRSLICPINYIPTYGKCQRLFKTTDGFALAFVLRLTSEEYFPKGSNDLYDVFKTADVAINGIIKNQDGNCRLYSTMLTTESTIEYMTMFAKVVITTSSSCLESNILDIANKFDNRSIVLNVTFSLSYAFNMHLLFQSIEPGKYYEIYSNHDYFPTPTYLTPLLCPRILISGADYVMAKKKNNLIQTDHYFKFHLNKENQNLSNITFEICVDEYYVSSGSTSLRIMDYCTSNMKVCIMNTTFFSLLGVLLSIGEHTCRATVYL